MHRTITWSLGLLVALCLPAAAFSQQSDTLAGTRLLTLQGDLSAQMVAGIDVFLMRELENSVAQRTNYWARDFSSREAYDKSVQPNRERLRKYIGAVDARVPATALEFIHTSVSPAKVGESAAYTVYAVRWPVFGGVFGEGLLLQPKGERLACVVVIPDADQNPEQLAGLAPGEAPEAQLARRLAENGCQVLVPVLIDRRDTWSGNPVLKRFTNQPHREWIYRQAFEMGRHIIGYEAQKVLAAVDLFYAQAVSVPGDPPSPAVPGLPKVGVVGYAEGGLIALYSAALDTRIEGALVSGYFDSRQRAWEEPIYRNVFGLLQEFGDAEIASLIAPRRLIVEHSEVPQIKGPPASRQGRSGAAPGKWATPDFNTVDGEHLRAKALVQPITNAIELVHGTEGMAVGPGSERALLLLLQALGYRGEKLKPAGPPAADLRQNFNPDERQHRQIDQLVEHTQRLLRSSERVRDEFFWSQTKREPAEWSAASKALKTNLWEQVIGKLPPATLAANPRTRKAYDQPKWTGYEVVLDVYPDVFAWGVLLLPKDIKAGERRPVVVCQHGLEGVPADVVTQDANNRAYAYYKGYAAQLAERGFVVFAPHNPYRGGDKFRVLQRKANLLHKHIFSIILAQHERILDWLSEQPYVDASRIGFYGLSYGGKTAMRVPALLDRYALSICSADFNEWIKKNATVDSGYSYMFTGEYEIFEFDLGHTFNYAEMGALIAPRPFMVERGHHDGVAPDEWVAYEYAKIRRFYAQLGLPDRTELEFFNGPHTINGVGTFKFLHKHLNWPLRNDQ